MTPTSIIFWSSALIIGYTYIGYGVLMLLLSRMRKSARSRPVPPGDYTPPVTLVIAAYNEEAVIVEKLRNTFDLDYPPSSLSVIVVTDGSTDNTPWLVSKLQNVRLLHQPERKGKIHAVNRVMKEVDTPIVVFSDANTMLNRASLRNIVRHYQDPCVGGVAGEKRIQQGSRESAPGAGEGLYWKYESFLKRLDSQVGSVVGAAGELFSIRSGLYEPPPENMIIEDFFISMGIAAKGFRFVYEPEAYAIETSSATIGDEWKRKVRISSGGFQAIVRLRRLLNPFRYGILTIQYISHRVLRWTLAPLALVAILVSNMYLVVGGPFYGVALAGQTVFYSLAFIGWLLRKRRISVRGFFVPFYFVVMNLSVFVGFVRFLLRRQSVIWERAGRATFT